MQRLNPTTFGEGLRVLVGRDPDLAAVLSRFGRPANWGYPPGFAILVRLILEQSVSLASARAVYRRLETRAGQVTPAALLALTVEAMQGLGLSRRKAATCHYLAAAVAAGRLDIESLPAMDASAVRDQLTAVKGIGPWTADVYLLRYLGHPDIWPVGDVAIRAALQDVKRLAARPTPHQAETLGDPWRPWRSVAACLLWQHYSCARRGGG